MPQHDEDSFFSSTAQLKYIHNTSIARSPPQLHVNHGASVVRGSMAERVGSGNVIGMMVSSSSSADMVKWDGRMLMWSGLCRNGSLGHLRFGVFHNTPPTTTQNIKFLKKAMVFLRPVWFKKKIYHRLFGCFRGLAGSLARANGGLEIKFGPKHHNHNTASQEIKFLKKAIEF